MSKFKPGDKVKVIANSSNHDQAIGSEVAVLKDRDSVSFNYRDNWYMNDCDAVLINNKINMNIIEKFALAFKSEPEKTFRKAGITNGDDLFTDDGQKVFLSWLLKKHGEDFKKEVVDEILKEEKKD